MTNINKSFFDKQEQSLEERIWAVDRFDGLDYATVMNCVGNNPQHTIRKEQTIERTWIEDGYSVCLLFDEQDICLGVWEEQKK